MFLKLSGAVTAGAGIAPQKNHKNIIGVAKAYYNKGGPQDHFQQNYLIINRR